MKIKDDLLAPYQIEFDGTQYTVGVPKTDKKGIESLSNTHYYSSLSNALKKIVSLKMGSDNTQTKDLKEYIKEYNEMLLRFTTSIQI